MLIYLKTIFERTKSGFWTKESFILINDFYFNVEKRVIFIYFQWDIFFKSSLASSSLCESGNCLQIIMRCKWHFCTYNYILVFYSENIHANYCSKNWLMLSHILFVHRKIYVSGIPLSNIISHFLMN